ncbi:hypothetical protein LZS94_04570 [Aliivibrio fischeri]|uniref:hypothetical protein n=1 Tax=Aliivibrio fischeri TaxID=668 RepID=UPI0007C51019|nr:hypothetical protein [Aliivibrio fischeri]MCE7576761.1 hypothetical protein [Aliivibrio fischeri]MCE7589117.1 hypothetical protein [Aliivibrio fischeri]
MKHTLLAILLSISSFNIFAYGGATEVGPKVSCELPDGTVSETYLLLCKGNGGTVKVD